MNYLAVDTSGAHLTVVLSYNGKTYEYFDEHCNLQHSVNLLKRTEELLEEAGATLKEMDAFGCVTGAGSFTGIRIGVSTVKAFCQAFNKPAVSVTSFDVLAYNLEGKNLAVISAGHDNFYAAGYDGKELVIKPCFLTKDKVIELSKEYTLIASEDILGLNVKKVDLLFGLKAALCTLIKNPISAKDLMPLYIRKSQAEENR